MAQDAATVKMGSLSKRDTTTGIIIIASLFFIFGFTSWVNGILIPYFKIAFQLTHFKSYLVTFAFYISYLLFPIPSSVLLRKVGFKKGMMIGLWTMSVGAIIFVPAALSGLYEVFLLGLFSIGAGLALLQTAANPYITILGPQERAAQRISIVGICNKGAGVIAPLIFSAVILRTTDAELFKQIPLMADAEKAVVLTELIHRVMVPYACVGVVLFALGLMIRYSPLPEIDLGDESDDVAATNSGKTSILQFPHLILGAIGIFLHIGTQIIAIDTIISYAASMNVFLPEAKWFVSYTLGATVTGYILGIIFIPKFVSQGNVLKICTVLGLVLTLLIVFASGTVRFGGFTADISIWFVVLLGLANSMVWPGLWAHGMNGLGKFTKVGASLMVMGLCGNGIMPLVYGHFADVYNVREAYWVLFPCYLYLIFYAFHGYRVKKW